MWALLVSALLLPCHAVILPPSCPSMIYCQGELLHDVQMSELYEDSKIFVDKKLLFSPQEIIQKYNILKDKYKPDAVSPDVLKNFVDNNFEDGNELEVWEPKDWKESPSLVNRIDDQGLKEWVLELNLIWKNLSRKVVDDVNINPDRYSLLYTENGFIIPGGRFTELYYWDTYWIVKGLLLCDMVETVKGVIDNLLSLVKRLGHVPNGSRVYYVERSQPPMLVQMVHTYLTSTASPITTQVFEVLNKEMEWWLKERSLKLHIRGKSYLLFRYNARSSGPRPESYREDVATVSMFQSPKERTNKYIALKSAAESGWDFSSRWFINNGSNRGNLSNIDTQNIIPVELNAILQNNFLLMSEWAKDLQNMRLHRKYKRLSDSLLLSIKEVLWQEDVGVWMDYDLKNGKRREYFYMSNLVPIWTGSHDFDMTTLSNSVRAYLYKNQVTTYVGGAPTSGFETGEQWDYPNAWPPLQAFLIQGLDKLDQPAKEDARMLASIWLKSNYKGFRDFNSMFEKYDSLLVGRTGSGGEYNAQTGFGWTNGVALEFLDRWGAHLNFDKQDASVRQV